MASTYTVKQKSLAWAVHLFTATGVLSAGLALLAILHNDPVLCIFWLALALVVDGVDGSLARRVDIKNALPEVDGSALDLIVDYLNYVFIPVLFMYYYVPFPVHTTLFILAAVLLSSLYCFTNVGMKSSDYYFVGFPATWNVVAFCLLLLKTAPAINLTICLLLCLLTFSKLKFIHPLRVRRWRLGNILMSAVSVSSGLAILLSRGVAAASPAGTDWLLSVWLVSSLYLVAVSLWRSLEDLSCRKN